ATLPASMQPPFSAGRVLGRSIPIVLSNAGAFVLMTILVNAPVILFGVWEARPPHIATEPAKPSIRQAVLFSGQIIAAALASGAVTFGALQQLREKPTGFSDCFRFGLARMPAVIGVSLATGFLELLGWVLCCAPGLVAASVLFVAVPAAVVE